MSRKYCAVCMEPHKNGVLGLCDQHLELEEINQKLTEAKNKLAFAEFMALDEEERWGMIFDFMQANRGDLLA